MNDNWINNSIKEYYNWLSNNSKAEIDKETGWYLINTPFLGLYNDHIVIYAKIEDDKILLSDDGETLKELELIGALPFKSNKRNEWLNMILLNYGIQLNDYEITTEGTLKDFVQKKHNIISAISEISDMSMLAKHNVASIFNEDIKSFFDIKKIIYTPQFIAKGNTGLAFTFDFQIAKEKQEVVIKSFNSLNTLNVSSFLFSCADIKEIREKTSGKELKVVAIINDRENKKIKPEYISAIESKDANTILWSQINEPGELRKIVA